MGRFEETVQAMQKVLELDEQNADALNYIGYSYADRGIKLDEAEDLVRKAMELKPNDGYITDSLGWIYFKKGMIKEAIRELKKAVTLAPDDALITEHLGDVYLEAGKEDKAKIQYERALHIDPEREELKGKLEGLKGQKD